MITSKKVAYVIGRLMTMRIDNKLDMSSYAVKIVDILEPTPLCHSVYCVGGWYVVANRERHPINIVPAKKDISFYVGADLMAKDLGFFTALELQVWARKNPLLWGNIYGYHCFLSERAYNYATDIAGVIKHLEGVADRLKIQEMSLCWKVKNFLFG